MLEYFTHKKVKKHQAEKRSGSHSHEPSPLLDDDDEHFLKRVISAEGTPPPLPERPHGLGVEAGDYSENASQMVVHDGRPSNDTRTSSEGHHRHHKDKGKGKEQEKDSEKSEAKKSNRLSFLQRTFTKKVSSPIQCANLL
jgi:hypothetical protein